MGEINKQKLKESGSRIEEGSRRGEKHQQTHNKPKGSRGVGAVEPTGHSIKEEVYDGKGNNFHFTELLEQCELLVLRTSTVRRILLAKVMNKQNNAVARRRTNLASVVLRLERYGRFTLRLTPGFEDHAAAFAFHTAINDATGIVAVPYSDQPNAAMARNSSCFKGSKNTRFCLDCTASCLRSSVRRMINSR
ncbi:hypothetical protein FHS16_003607 [Paenibacillus endophyticus]|uniref:Uncharacterized protein n=1 Tax=Paenibacillus endophyticus TaxID=1294268 RepID=A0A7W5C9E0_9BACL|nr:hypothetical protein [Paenibacillus endophyticus]MBB3153545.1 hypothetical protein [Paenibacillus endophyticus]